MAAILLALLLLPGLLFAQTVEDLDFGDIESAPPGGEVTVDDTGSASSGDVWGDDPSDGSAWATEDLVPERAVPDMPERYVPDAPDWNAFDTPDRNDGARQGGHHRPGDDPFRRPFVWPLEARVVEIFITPDGTMVVVMDCPPCCCWPDEGGWAEELDDDWGLDGSAWPPLVLDGGSDDPWSPGEWLDPAAPCEPETAGGRPWWETASVRVRGGRPIDGASGIASVVAPAVGASVPWWESASVRRTGGVGAGVSFSGESAAPRNVVGEDPLSGDGPTGEDAICAAVRPASGVDALAEAALRWGRVEAPHVRNPNNGRTGPLAWDGWCLGFVARAWSMGAGHAVAELAAESAALSLERFRNAGKLRQDFRRLPKGAPIFWDCGESGHVALATGRVDASGDPIVLSTWIGGGHDGIFELPLRDFTPYVGSPSGWGVVD